MPITRLAGVAVLCVALSTVPAAARERPLIDAVKNADVAAVRTMLRQHVDVNAADADGTTALHWAVHRDDLETADLLLRAGADAHATNRYGATPLYPACVNGNRLMIERLLTAGADANTAMPDGETALMTAARTGKADAVSALLARGATVDAKERSKGQTALMWAAAENNAAAIRVLIDGGADLHVRSKGGFTPFLFAVRGGALEAAKTLLSAGADVNELLPDGMSPLVLSVLNAQYDLASWLLDKGANPNADANGWTALHQLAWTRRPNTGLNNPGPVPAGSLDSLELAKQLVAHGANLNARQRQEPQDGYRNALNRIGATPFFLAAKAVDVDYMRVLADNGADPWLANVDGTTPLMAAAGVGLYGISENPGTESEALDAVRFALELGSDVSAVDRNGDTVVHGAALRAANSVVELLAAKGARLDARNSQNWTPLRIAEGVYYNGAFKRFPETAAVIRRLLKERGLSSDEQAAR